MAPSGPRPSDVSSDDVRYLLAVARAGRLVTAGALLGVDHTTVKRRIDRLEASLGGKLVAKGSDGWVLTALGREVVAHAASIEEAMERVVGVARGGRSGVHGTVRVSAPEGFGAQFVAPALARVSSRHPGVVTELVTSTRPLAVRGSGQDLTVTIGSRHQVRPGSEVLSPYVLRLYASREYLAGHPPVLSADDLLHHRLVFYVDGLLTVHELDLAPVLGGMQVGFGSTSVFAQLEATRRGAGIGLLHAFMGGADASLERVLPELEFPLQFSLTTRRDAPAVEAVALVRDELFAEVTARADELVPA